MIPTSADLKSATMTHRPGELFNPPALTNFLGCVQVGVDPVAVCNLNFPPLATGETTSGVLYLEGKLFASTGEPVSFTWYPDRVERRARWDGWEIASTTALVWGKTACIVRFTITNGAGTERRLDGGLAIQGTITRSVDGWQQPSAPTGGPTRGAVDVDRQAVGRTSPSGETSIQGLVASSCAPDDRGVWFDLALRPGESFTGVYVYAVADDPATARALYDAVVPGVAAEIERTRDEWDAELAAAFTPGNDRYSGSLPVLETSDADLLRLYHLGILGVIYFKRQSPHSVVGRTYDTLMPRYWQTTTYLWDYSLSSTVHALLDPAVMRSHLARWMTHDIHACYGTEWLTGRPVGIWYSVNDYAMTHMIDEYVTWSGNREWLAEPVDSGDGDAQTVADLFRGYAENWRQYASRNGLADYGGVGNLLECVSSYVHEVASLNAANVWSLRTVARHLEDTDPATMTKLRDDADELVKRLWELYEDGEGWFNARQPDGRLLPVRHCYDLMTVLGSIPDDISSDRRDEMVRYFQSQLQTPTWMRALSPEDPDAVTSLRPDHQWNGSYTAWPAGVAAGLFDIGREDVASEWLHGLARTANQGPFAQAHFTEDFASAEAGGARKASYEEPYINDWACSSGGAWAKLVIRSVFGVDPSGGDLEANPRLERLDPDARLVDLSHRGKLHTVDRDGARPA